MSLFLSIILLDKRKRKKDRGNYINIKLDKRLQILYDIISFGVLPHLRIADSGHDFFFYLNKIKNKSEIFDIHN